MKRNPPFSHGILLLVGLGVIAASCAVFLCFEAAHARIYQVWVGNIDLTGLTREEAGRKLASFKQNALNGPVILCFRDQKWEFIPAYYGFNMNIRATVENAWRIGRKSWPWGSRPGRGPSKKTVLDLEVAVDKSKFASCITVLRSQIDTPPKQARIIGISHGQPLIAGGTAGYSLDEEKLKKMLAKAMLESAPRSVNLPVREIKPRIFREDLAKYRFTIIGSFTTEFDPALADRAHNISLAVSAVNGTVLYPGEIFSYNGIVGPRVGARGYKEANVMIRGILAPGIGGGVCQVSTTLYSAALFARLEIRERKNHTSLIPYVPPGQDATVEYGKIDLKIRNNRKSPVIINCRMAEENKVTADIWGEDQYPGEEVKLDSFVNKVIPCRILEKKVPALPVGQHDVAQKGMDGYEVLLYRIVYKNGKEIQNEMVAKSVYSPIPEIVLVGCGSEG
ncbi:MAG: VanW family protein [Bacillota bacterium]